MVEEKSLFEKMLDDGIGLYNRRQALHLIETVENEIKSYRDTSITSNQLIDKLEEFCLHIKQNVTQTPLY